MLGPIHAPIFRGFLAGMTATTATPTATTTAAKNQETHPAGKVCAKIKTLPITAAPNCPSSLIDPVASRGRVHPIGAGVCFSA